MTQQENIEEMVRDFTKVTPLPKSEVRRRLNNLLQSQREQIMRYIENMPNATRDEVNNEKVICSDDIINHLTNTYNETRRN